MVIQRSSLTVDLLPLTGDFQEGSSHCLFQPLHRKFTITSTRSCTLASAHILFIGASHKATVSCTEAGDHYLRWDLGSNGVGHVATTTTIMEEGNNVFLFCFGFNGQLAISFTFSKSGSSLVP